MQDFVSKRQKVLEIMQSAAAFAQHQGREDLYEEISYESQYLAEGKLTLMVGGEFKRGKSSLINMLLEKPALCPVAVHITTCAVTVITYGKKERITVYFRQENDYSPIGAAEKDNGLTITREQLPEYVSEQYNQKNNKRVSLIKIELPHPLLEKGLVIVDTPGVGGLYREHSLITLGFMSAADAVLFVCDAQNPIAESELAFLQKAADYTQNFIFALTHKDLVLDCEKVIAGNCQKIASRLGIEPELIKIIPVSSKAKNSYLETQIEEYLANSNYPALEKEIWEMLTGRGGAILLLRALLTLDMALEELGRPLTDELTILRAKEKEGFQVLENEINQLRRQTEGQNTQQANWRGELSRGIQHISNEITHFLQTDYTNLRYDLKKYIQDQPSLDEAAIKDISWFMEDKLQTSQATVAQKFGKMVNELSGKIERTANIDLMVANINNPQLAISKINSSQDFDKSDTWEYVKNGAIGATIGTTIGATVGGFLGGLFTGGLGTIVGAKLGAVISVGIGTIFTTVYGWFGGAHAIKKAHDHERAKAEAALWTEINHVLEQAKIDNDKWLKKTMMELSTALEEDFKAKLDKRLSEIKETEKKLKAAYNTSREEDNRQKASLEADCKILANYKNEVARQINAAKAKLPFAK